ncbi:MAG TPA: hypothetical protein VGF50_06760 [Caulobacteraceae bacterium]
MAAEAIADGRRARRERVLLAGKIVCAESYSFDCMIRERSETGAKLRARTSNPFPSEFHLLDVRAGQAHACELIWTDGPNAGVRFTQTWDVTRPCPPPLGHLHRLWVECAPRASDF